MMKFNAATLAGLALADDQFFHGQNCFDPRRQAGADFHLEGARFWHTGPRSDWELKPWNPFFDKNTHMAEHGHHGLMTCDNGYHLVAGHEWPVVWKEGTEAIKFRCKGPYLANQVEYNDHIGDHLLTPTEGPRCVKNEDLCDAPRNVQNGFQTKVNDQSTYYCKEGYHYPGSDATKVEVRCNADHRLHRLLPGAPESVFTGCVKNNPIICHAPTWVKEEGVKKTGGETMTYNCKDSHHTYFQGVVRQPKVKCQWNGNFYFLNADGSVSTTLFTGCNLTSRQLAENNENEKAEDAENLLIV